MILDPIQVRLWASAQAVAPDGRNIVFTNGCFDILHAGHVALLRFAKEMFPGSWLLVAVNTDASVSLLKGPGRPVNTLKDRLQVLDALKPVDVVTWFDENTPEDLIMAIQPRALLKGEDSKGKVIPGAHFVKKCGGQMVFGPYLQGRSTTSIVEQVRANI